MRGRDLVIKDGTGGGATVIAAMRQKALRLNNTMVDITSDDSAGVRTLLAAAGTASISLSGQGVLTSAAIADTLIARVAAMSIDDYEIAMGSNRKIVGNFQLTSFEAAGTHDGEQTYTISLESSGSWTVTAAS